jgi:hypothetical protein
VPPRAIASTSSDPSATTRSHIRSTTLGTPRRLSVHLGVVEPAFLSVCHLTCREVGPLLNVVIALPISILGLSNRPRSPDHLICSDITLNGLAWPGSPRRAWSPIVSMTLTSSLTKMCRSQLPHAGHGPGAARLVPQCPQAAPSMPSTLGGADVGHATATSMPTVDQRCTSRQRVSARKRTGYRCPRANLHRDFAASLQPCGTGP